MRNGSATALMNGMQKAIHPHKIKPSKCNNGGGFHHVIVFAEEESSFDPKAFCRLSLARRASLTDEEVSARRWNLSSDQGINRSISIGSQLSSSSLDMRSLRKLAGTKTMGERSTHSQQSVIRGCFSERNETSQPYNE